jgi:replicative DNA helicase
MDEIIEGIRNPGQVMRQTSGIPKLDEMTAGFRREDLVLIVGGTSHGKSTLAQQIAVESDNAGYKGIIFSAEMSKKAIAKRELSHTADVPLYLLRRPEKIHSPDSIIRKLVYAAGEESKRKLLVVDHDITPSRVWSLCEMVHKSQGLDFVIVDYDQLVIREGMGRGDNEYAEQARFVADALEMCKRLKLCFMLLCQPRKLDQDVASGKRAPRVEEIFGSSAVANTAHHILWVIRRFFQKQMNVENEGEAAVYILKARNDKAGHVDIGFDPDRVIFVNDPPSSEATLPYKDN